MGTRSQRFDRSRRLLNSQEFSHVFRAGEFKVGGQGYLLIARRSGAARSRLGLAIAKRYLPRAVDRNRVKRVAREAFRLRFEPEHPLDVVLMARQRAQDFAGPRLFTHLAAMLDDLQRRAEPEQASCT